MKTLEEIAVDQTIAMSMGLAKCKKPIVAVIRGGCYGMGFTLI